MRGQIVGNLIRLAAVLEPLAELGADAADGDADPRPPARLTCLSLPDGPRDVAADLAAALIVQWATRSVADESGFRPAVILAGADEQSTRHLSRLTTVCERYEVPLVRMFSRLTEESSRHLDSRHTAFMRLATRPEALRAAEHIGLERKFVAGRFSHRRSVSRLSTKTSTESTTHTTGRAEGEATTHTTGTTTGQMYSEAQVPRHENHVHIHADRAAGNGSGSGDSGSGGSREEFRARVAREREAAAAKESGRGRARQPSGGGGDRPQGQPKSGGGWVSAGGGGKPVMDTVKTRTKFSAEHTSDAKTQSVTNTEETSRTRSESRSRTEGSSVGDEISFELVYDHTVQPETLMALPEDQMLAPHVVAGAPDASGLPAAANRAAAAQRLSAAPAGASALPGGGQRPRAGWSPSSSTRRSSAPTRWPRSPRTRSRPTSPPPRRSPRTSPTTSASRAAPSARATPPTPGSGSRLVSHPRGLASQPVACRNATAGRPAEVGADRPEAGSLPGPYAAVIIQTRQEQQRHPGAAGDHRPDAEQDNDEHERSQPA
jgi:hypothetical protein